MYLDTLTSSPQVSVYLYTPLLLQGFAVATLTVDFYLIEYNNPTSVDCYGNSCYGNCNNKFIFCLREVGHKSDCLAVLHSDVYAQDSIKFRSGYHQLRISNPLRFSSIHTSVSNKYDPLAVVYSVY